MPKPKKKRSYENSEVSKFCIFWIPCVFHAYLNIVSGQEIQKQEFVTRQNFKFKVKSEATINNTIQSWDGKLIINLTIIEITESDPEFKKNIKVRLVSKDVRRNGLIKFEYSLSPEQHRLFDDMRDQAYNLIKKHFHIHEFHTYFTSVKNGFYEDVDLCSVDNDAISWYVSQFYTLLKEQLKQIEDDYKWLELNKTNYSPELNEARYLFYASCENVFGQLVYYNSILNSKWNESCRLIPTTTTPDEELRRLAHNYYNLISKLQSIYQRSRTFFYLSNIHQNVETQQKIQKVAKDNNILIGKVDDVLKKSSTTNVISICLAILSVLLGIWSIYLALREENPTEHQQIEISTVTPEHNQDILKDTTASFILQENINHKSAVIKQK